MKKQIISKFKEKPKTKTAWWAMGLGLAVIFSPTFFGIFAAVIRPLIDKVTSENIGAAIGFSLIPALLILLVAALATSISAFKKGERSWVLWIGFVPAILGCAFWVLMIIGEFVFPH